MPRAEQTRVLEEALEAIAEGSWGALLDKQYGGVRTGPTVMQRVSENSEIRVLARLALSRAHDERDADDDGT